MAEEGKEGIKAQCGPLWLTGFNTTWQATCCPFPIVCSLGMVDVCQGLNKFEACKVVDECVLPGKVGAGHYRPVR